MSRRAPHCSSHSARQPLSLLCYLSVSIASLVIPSPASAGVKGVVHVNLTLPDEIYPEQPDSYVCGTTTLPNTPHKLVGVVPIARQEVAHHMLLFACSDVPQTPAAGKVAAWKCGEMGTCSRGESMVIYGWGKNAPELMLPEGVGYSVGPGSGIRHIVLQVHYFTPRPKGDRSGVVLRLVPHATPLAAGLISFANFFTIPKRSPSYLVRNQCCYHGHQPLTAFAVRVHTHALGRAVYMTRPYTNGTVGLETLAHRDPQLPQAFVPVVRSTLWPGDRLTVTCDFNSSEVDHDVSTGGTHKDEMCNMYVMLYAPTPFIGACGGGEIQGPAQDSTSDLHTHGSFLPDPMPTWRPPNSASTGLAAGLGHCTGVATGRNGTLWALFRGSRPWLSTTFSWFNRVTDKAPIPEDVVVQLDGDTGRVLRKWGAATFFMPHMITTDRHGNIWVVDTGRHQVIKFSPSGQELLAVGTKLVPGNTLKHLCKPTKVVVANDDSFYVADGYCNSRVVIYDKAGQHIGALSVPGSGVVHSVLLNECDKLVYVASREDSKVYTFDEQQTLTHTWDLAAFGKPWSLMLGPLGALMALAWTQGQTPLLVELKRDAVERTWPLPGMEDVMPHDVALGAAAQELTGAGDRLFALYVAAICQPDAASCSPLHKYIMSRPDWTAPSHEELVRLTTRQAHDPTAVTAGRLPVRAGPVRAATPSPAVRQPLHAARPAASPAKRVSPTSSAHPAGGSQHKQPEWIDVGDNTTVVVTQETFGGDQSQQHPGQGGKDHEAHGGQQQQQQQQQQPADVDAEWDVVTIAEATHTHRATAGQVLGLVLIAVVVAGAVVGVALIMIRRQQQSGALQLSEGQKALARPSRLLGAIMHDRSLQEHNALLAAKSLHRHRQDAT